MRKNITRSFTISTIRFVQCVITNGKVENKEMPPLVLSGKYDTESAVKEVKKVYGKDKAILITEIVASDETYEISVDDFLKYATKVEPQNKTEESPEN